MEVEINTEECEKYCQLDESLNSKEVIIDREISFTKKNKIHKLMKQKEKMKHEDCWETFLSKNNTHQCKEFKKLKLDTIDDELFYIIEGMSKDFNALKVSKSEIKIDELTQKILKKLSEFNIFEKFISATHGYFKFFQNIFSNKINAINEAKQLKDN